MISAAYALCVAVALLLIVASFLPLLETRWWFVRLLDFPPLQFLLLLVGIGSALLIFHHREPWLTLALLAAVFSAICYHVIVLWPYRPSGKRLRHWPDTAPLSVMVANVQQGNRNAAVLLRMIEKHQFDLFLALETDQWWDQALQALAQGMPNALREISGSYYGIAFFSRLLSFARKSAFSPARKPPPSCEASACPPEKP